MFPVLPVKTDLDIDTTGEDSPKIFFFYLPINQIIVVANNITDKSGTISFEVSK